MGAFTPWWTVEGKRYAAKKHPLLAAMRFITHRLSISFGLWLGCFTAFGQPSALPSSLSLSEAEELLVSHSLAVLASKDQIEIADAVRRVAGLKPNPVLRIGIDQLPAYTGVPGFLPNFSRTNPDGGANPTYTTEFGLLFERGGKRRLRSEQAEAVLDATKSQSLDVLREQLLVLREAFTAGLLAKANLELAEETDEQYAETERLMEVRLRSGEIAEVDLDRVKAARLPFLQAVIEARLAYTQSAQKVMNLLGVTQDGTNTRVVDLAGDLEVAVSIPSLAELRMMAAEERPDLQSARSGLRAAERGTQLAESQRKRDIYGSFLAQRTGQDYAIGASVSIPLFLFNNQRAAIDQAAAEQRFVSTLVRQTAVQVQGDVDRAYEAVQANRQALELFSKDAVERSREIRSVITYSYQRGEADLLEVLDAQRSANQILTGYNQARANYMNSIWQLQSAVGRAF